ncbi:MAG: N-acetyltransferase family protein [Planctomycetota bacterium]
MAERFANLTIRDATAADLPAVVAIHNESIPGRRASAYLEPVTVEGRKEWFGAHSPDRRPLWVVCDDTQEGQVIAWGCLTDYSPRPAYAITAEVSLYITPGRQGEGIGPWLMQRLVDECPRLGVERVVSLVFEHNRPSVRMHEKLNFEQWGLLPGVCDMAGVRRDVVVLGKRIDAAAVE